LAEAPGGGGDASDGVESSVIAVLLGLSAQQAKRVVAQQPTHRRVVEYGDDAETDVEILNTIDRRRQGSRGGYERQRHRL
jgi:hypothetical protein